MKALHYLCIILYTENMPYAILIILVVYSKNCETGNLLWMDCCLRANVQEKPQALHAAYEHNVP